MRLPCHQTKELLVNADGSVDIYFGPKPSAGKENNWVQTNPGTGWIQFFGFMACLSLGLTRLGDQGKSSCSNSPI